MTIKEYVLELLKDQPNLDNETLAGMCRKKFPGANTSPASISSIKSNARKSGELERVEMEGISEALLEEDEELADTSGESDEAVGERIQKRFDAMDRMSLAVMKGGKESPPAMIVSGPAGLGKSYGIEQALEKRKEMAREAGFDFKYDYIQGAISPVGLYIAAWNHRERGNVIVLDDTDSVFADEDSLNLLKSMLDSTDRRMLSWRKKSRWLEDLGIDDNFEFEGSVIFLTNIDFERKIESGKSWAVHFQALRDRCLYLHLTIRTIQDFLVRIRHVVYGAKMLDRYGFTEEDTQQLMDYIYRNRKRFYHLSLRLVHQIALLKMSDPENWEADVEMTKMRADTEKLADAVEKIVEGADADEALKGVATA